MCRYKTTSYEKTGLVYKFLIWYYLCLLTVDCFSVESNVDPVLTAFERHVRHNEMSRTERRHGVGDILTGRSTDSNLQCSLACILDVNWCNKQTIFPFISRWSESLESNNCHRIRLGNISQVVSGHSQLTLIVSMDGRLCIKRGHCCQEIWPLTIKWIEYIKNRYQIRTEYERLEKHNNKPTIHNISTQ